MAMTDAHGGLADARVPDHGWCAGHSHVGDPVCERLVTHVEDLVCEVEDLVVMSKVWSAMSKIWSMMSKIWSAMLKIWSASPSQTMLT